MRALVLIFAICAAAFCADDPVSLAVVKTWAELASQPAIALDGGGKVHLGIEALEVPAEGAVLVYCMTEDVPVKDSFSSATFTTMLGPLKLKSSEPFIDTGANFAQIMAVQGLARQPMEKGRALYMQLARVDNPPVVSVLASNGKVLAEARVTISPEPPHPWLAFALESNRNPKQQMVNGFAMPLMNHIAEAALIPGVSVALPRYDGGAPVLTVEEDGTRKPIEFKDDQRLPTFLDPPPAAAPSAELKKKIAEAIAQLSDDDFDVRQRASAALKKLGPEWIGLLREEAAKNNDPEVHARLAEAIRVAEGPVGIAIENLKLAVTTPLMFTDMNFFQNFIARWWVNGKPFTKTGNLNAIGVELNNQQDFCMSASIELKQMAQALGAKKGDKIALQILFSPDGTRARGSDNDAMLMQRMIMMAAMGQAEPSKVLRVPMRSKKLEFILP